MVTGTQDQQVSGLGLDQAQIADVINRQKIGNIRQRNEMMRLGTSDPSAFALQNQPAIQQAEQPSEFLGAGRKEVANPNIDSSLSNLFNVQTTGGHKFYYGDYDPSNAQWGTTGYGTEDVGNGKYNIIGKNGTVLGTGYKSLEDTIREMGGTPTEMGKGLGNWEILGQMLSGKTQTPAMSEGGLSLNDIEESISGANTLYGSTPLLAGDKLLGYKTNLGAGTESGSWSNNGPDKQTWTPFGYQASHSGKSHSWNTALSRELQNPSAYNSLGKMMNPSTYEYFVNADTASQLPGWINRESASHMNAGEEGLLSAVFGVLDPILDKLDPMHNQVQTWTTGSKTTEGQTPYFQKILPMILNGFFPGVGSAVSAVDSGTRGDWGGAAGNAVGSYLGATGGIDTGYGQVANSAANSAAANALGAAGSGGDFKDMLKAAALGALSGGAGGSVGQATSDQGKAISEFLSGATKGAVSGLAQPKSMLESVLSSGLSGGLGGLFNSDVSNRQQQNSNNELAKNVVRLGQLFAKRK